MRALPAFLIFAAATVAAVAGSLRDPVAVAQDWTTAVDNTPAVVAPRSLRDASPAPLPAFQLSEPDQAMPPRPDYPERHGDLVTPPGVDPASPPRRAKKYEYRGETYWLVLAQETARPSP